MRRISAPNLTALPNTVTPALTQTSRRLQPMLAALALVVAILAMTLALWGALDLYINPTTAQERMDLVTVLLQILAGTLVIIAFYVVGHTVQVNQQGQVTERFNKAVDHIGASDDKGNPRLEIRLGGIYALERIARDSVRDHWPIMEILTAYVRLHAPWREPADSGQAQPPTSERPEPGLRPRSDIQAVLTVLGRRARFYGKGEERALDLHGTDLRGGDLRNTHLEGADLRGAHLEGAYLVGADLKRADLEDASLRGTNLGVAHLEGAELSGAHLEEAILSGAYLEGANLEEAFLDWANLEEAHLKGAILAGARLEGADLGAAHLEETNLDGAHLGGAYLVGADLKGAGLEDAHLKGANLGNAHLEGADLRGAHLEEANLGGAHLEGAYLVGADLKGANLEEAHLKGANLGVAHLKGANLMATNLEGASLGGANLEGANLLATNLEGADLGDAHLEGADLRHAVGVASRKNRKGRNDRDTRHRPIIEVATALASQSPPEASPAEGVAKSE